MSHGPHESAGASLASKLPTMEVYFDPPGKCYLIRDSSDEFIAISEGSLKRHLKEAGVFAGVKKTEQVSELDRLLNSVQKAKNVHYAAPLAGYSVGVHSIEHRRVLVTEPPRLIEPEEGPWPTLRLFIENLLGPEQAEYFYGWMQNAIRSLRARKRRPAQVLVIAGPHGCGKSLLQNLITKLLGGRSAQPYQYMSGATQFNSELFQAEHLMIEDQAASFDLRVRRQFGRNLNAFIVNETQRCHPKNRPALTLKPFWWVSVTLNDEAENLMVLPPMEESLLAKFMLFRAHKAPLPMPTDTLEQWAAFMQVIDAELPRFIHFLLHRHHMPADKMDDRFGVSYYHNPELMRMMSTLAPETKLLELIDTELFADGRQWPTLPEGCAGFEGKASDLEAKLCAQSSSVAHEARKLMLYNSACGQYLGRLMRIHPDRLSDRIRDGYTIWKILPPPSSADSAD